MGSHTARTSTKLGCGSMGVAFVAVARRVDFFYPFYPLLAMLVDVGLPRRIGLRSMLNGETNGNHAIITFGGAQTWLSFFLTGSNAECHLSLIELLRARQEWLLLFSAS